jgi:hypothetical protein
VLFGVVIVFAGCRALLGIDDKYLIDTGAGASGGGGRGSGGDGADGGGGACDPRTAPPAACASGTADCNENPCDGCETDLDVDPDHCGRCHRSCGDETCSGATCAPAVLAPSGSWVYDMTESGGRLYWAHDRPPRVMSVSTQGGGLHEIAASEGGPAGIRADDTHVYWGSLFGNAYGIARAPIAGGAAEPIAPQQSYTDRIVLDGPFVYWATSGAPGVRVGRVPKVGGPVEVLFEAEPPTGRALPLEVDATRVYWGVFEGPDVGVWSVEKDGTDPKQLSGLGPVHVLAVDEEAIFFADEESASILRLPKGGANPAQIATGQGEVHGLVIDQDAVYFTSVENGIVARIGKDGTGYQVLARNQYGVDPELGVMCIDDTHVYWVAAGTILRTPK